MVGELNGDGEPRSRPSYLDVHLFTASHEVGWAKRLIRGKLDLHLRRLATTVGRVILVWHLFTTSACSPKREVRVRRLDEAGSKQ